MKRRAPEKPDVAYVTFMRGGFSEPPSLRVTTPAGAFAEFATIGEAVEWAATVAPRARVSIEEHDAFLVGDWPDVDAPPLPSSGPERDRLDRYVARRLERWTRERKERRNDEVEWFFAVLNPEVEELDSLEDTLAEQPEVQWVRVWPDEWNGVWYSVGVLARSCKEALNRGNDAFLRIAWPPERIQAVFGEGDYFVGVGHQVCGLAEYEAEELGDPSR